MLNFERRSGESNTEARSLTSIFDIRCSVFDIYEPATSFAGSRFVIYALLITPNISAITAITSNMWMIPPVPYAKKPTAQQITRITAIM